VACFEEPVMIDHGAVGCLQAAPTRCGGFTGLAQAALCDAHGLDVAAHCAPQLSIHRGTM
jgi:L-alanine-DL-glutamate epimerase-like enolase superfamily enzyme